MATRFDYFHDPTYLFVRVRDREKEGKEKALPSLIDHLYFRDVIHLQVFGFHLIDIRPLRFEPLLLSPKPNSSRRHLLLYLPNLGVCY